MDKSEKLELAKKLIKECKKQDIKVDCWSVKNDNVPSGKATLDCDIAIDVCSVPTTLSLPFTTGVVDYDDTLTRLKFIVND